MLALTQRNVHCCSVVPLALPLPQAPMAAAQRSKSSAYLGAGACDQSQRLSSIAMSNRRRVRPFSHPSVVHRTRENDALNLAGLLQPRCYYSNAICMRLWACKCAHGISTLLLSTMGLINLKDLHCFTRAIVVLSYSAHAAKREIG